MNVFITTGTYDFLKKISDKHQEENMILMLNENTALLYHETDGKTYFKEPRSYEVVDGNGHIQNGKFFVMNNVPVTEEGRPIFEHRFKNRARLIDKQKGFYGIRVLRPKSSDTYIVLTAWEKEEAYEKWKSSLSFKKSHTKTSHDPSKEKSIFSRPSYVTKYFVPKKDETNEENL